MTRLTRLYNLTPLLVALTLFMSGCGDDDVPESPEACGLDCEAGDTRCDGDDVELCGFDDDGCHVWKAVLTCGSGLCAEGTCDQACRDGDGDGYGPSCDAGPDCDDTDAERYPDATELCDGIDNNCDGVVDEGLSECAATCDSPCTPGARACTDGNQVQVCVAASGCAGWVTAEVCGFGLCADGACLPVDCHDLDGDGFGVGTDCVAEVDCDDTDAGTYPGAPEVCDLHDNSCDGVVDQGVTCELCPNQPCFVGERLCDGATVFACVPDAEGCGTLAPLRVCAANRVCADGDCAIYLCDDDGFEPNDRLSGASPMAEGTSMAGLCRRDRDFYDIGQLEAGTVLHISAQAEAPLDLVLYIDEQYAYAAPGAVHQFFADAGDVIVEVSSPDVAETAYALNVQIERPQECVATDDEPNDDLAGATAGDGSPLAASICPVAEVDVYGPIVLATDERLVATVGVGSIAGALALDVLDMSGGATLASARQADGLVAAWHATEPQEVALRVGAGLTGSFGDYDIRWQVLASTACPVDANEPNDDAQTAATLVFDAQQAAVTAALCPGDDDWFQLGELEAGQLVRAELVNDSAVIEVWRSDDDAPLSRSGFDGTAERLVWQVPANGAGTYMLRVLDLSASTVTYDLNVEVQQAQPCFGDASPSNGNITDAADVGLDRLHAARLCAQDEDWYRIGNILDTPEALELFVELNAEGSTSGLELQLFRNTALVATSHAVAGGLQVRYAPPSGSKSNYHARVLNTGDAARGYQLLARLQGPGVCRDDAFEPDNSPSTASPLPVDTLVRARVCTDDTDWYALDGLRAGQHLRLHVEFSHNDGDIDLRLVRDGVELAISGTGDSDEMIEYDIDRDGRYTLEVVGFEGAQAEYTIVYALE